MTGFFLFIILFTVIRSSPGHGNPGGSKFELIHRHHLERKPATQIQRLRQLLHSDTIRLREISHKVRLRQGHFDASRRQLPEKTTYYPACTNSSSSRRSKNDNNVPGEMPMHSGADYGTGQYFVRFRVGSPPQKLVLIADTGSDLTWMNCKYRYSDGSAALGLFADETVTFTLTNRRKTRLKHVLVGCSESTRGQSFQGADGVMGLGYSNYSFAVKAAKRFGGKFSYCLVDHLSPENVSSYLIFGSHKEVGITYRRMRYTELLIGVITPFYAVKIKGISIGGLMLDIPPETWNLTGQGGAIIDSGSSLTGLTQKAYQPVMAALKLSLQNFKNLNLDIGPLEYCFNSTGFDESVVPRLAFHFEDGARFEPPVKSYVIDAAPGVKCLGFVPLSWPGASVIGNIMQQNHLWEFDLANSRLGFAASSCI
ncbi:UNVERIFIED_CONTAM: Aspartic proteinase NANA, chloroplast [Sesamum calycinum]|uniref:Aspartic proteinase NANA, chloroplast n=1 Tax=Sesamum calycinum TaxID=2727403 RepID=A0AAW2Q5N3_9LAMI